MSLSLDATVGGASANAYATVAAADAVAAYRVGASAWASLTNDQKIQALVTATRDIDSIESSVSPGFIGGFLGDKADDDQALEWPRSGTDDFDDDELPPKLVEATIELAISYTPQFAASTGDVLNTDPATGNIKRDKTGPLETEYFAAEDEKVGTSLCRFPAMVERLLLSLVNASNSALWGAATVTRGS